MKTLSIIQLLKLFAIVKKTHLLSQTSKDIDS